MRTIPLLTLAAVLVPAAFAEVVPLAQTQNSAVPGTINYVEGSAQLSGQPLSPRSIGSAVLPANGEITTATGKVEVLLTPGVFLRVGENSTLRMVSPDLTHTEVSLQQGSAEIEVEQLYPQNHLIVDQGGTQTRLQKPGLYEFTANPNSVRVLDGKADALLVSGKRIEVKQGHLFDDTGDTTHTSKFNRNAFSDPLTDWSDLRADYLGQANQTLAANYADQADASYAGGWDWDSSLSGYTWLPGAGFAFSPFGYGFFSPLAFGGYGYPYGAFYGSGLGYFGGGFYGGGGIYGYRPGGFGSYGNNGYRGSFNNTAPRPGNSTVGMMRPGGYRGPARVGGNRPMGPSGGARGNFGGGNFGGSHGSFGGGGFGGAHGGGGGGGSHR